MPVKAYRYGIIGLPHIKPRAVDLVARNKDWLDKLRPSLSGGYADMSAATERILRIALQRNITGFMFEKDSKAVAIGTVILNQTVQFADGNLTKATDIDCWADEAAELDDNDNQQILDTLVEHARAKSSDPVFAALKPEEIPYAAGIDRMQAIGLPQVLAFPEGDPFDIGKGGVPLQVFGVKRA